MPDLYYPTPGHRHRGEPLPSVNVKVYNGPTRAQLDEIEREQDARGFADWYENETDNHGPWYELEEIAQQSALDDAQQDADMIFGPGVEVSLEGRSGGHLCVKGLPDLEGLAEFSEDEEGRDTTTLEWDRLRTDWPTESDGWNIEINEGERIYLGPFNTLAHRWRYFEACAHAAVKDFPRRVADLVCVNVYIPLMEEKAAKDADNAERAEIADALRTFAQSLGTDEEEYVLNRAAELLEKE